MTNPEIPVNLGGKNLTPEREAMIRDNFTKRKEMGRQPMEGEIGKNEKDILVIKLINEYLNEELRLLGVEKEIAIAPEQVHILPHRIFVHYTRNRIGIEPEPGLAGLNQSVEETIIVDNEAGATTQVLYRQIFHEAVHLAAWRKWSINLPDMKSQERVGYRIFHQEKLYSSSLREEDTTRRLAGFNEAVTEAIARDILKKRQNEEKIKELFSLPGADGVMAVFAYGDEKEILDTIVAGIAKSEHEDEYEVWRKIKRGYFTGEIMHLRDIEKAFGKNALEVISLLHAQVKGLSPQEVTNKIFAYFKTESEAERTRLYGELVKRSL